MSVTDYLSVAVLVMSARAMPRGAALVFAGGMLIAQVAALALGIK